MIQIQTRLTTIDDHFGFKYTELCHWRFSLVVSLSSSSLTFLPLFFSASFAFFTSCSTSSVSRWLLLLEDHDLIRSAAAPRRTSTCTSSPGTHGFRSITTSRPSIHSDTSSSSSFSAAPSSFVARTGDLPLPLMSKEKSRIVYQLQK